MKLVALVMGFSLLGAGAALAASPFEGAWSGSITGRFMGGSAAGAGACSGSASATVTDNAVQGTFQTGRVTATFSAKIEADGAVRGSVGPYPLTGKFDGKSFSASYSPPGNCANFQIQMKRS